MNQRTPGTASAGGAQTAAETDVELGRRAMLTEAEMIGRAASRLGADFARAVECVLATPGKIVVSGVGKSGQVAEKSAATLCSTGTPAVFLHPVDALHGGLGIYAPGDVTLVFSKSGATSELLQLVSAVRQFDSKTIAVLGNLESPLARAADIVLDASVGREADPHNLVPTASIVTAISLIDALAICLMRARRFRPENFLALHPNGQLGRNLRLTVRDVMHRPDEIALVNPDASVKSVVIAMTRRPFGAACIMVKGRLEGLITEGDLRRALERHDDIRPLKARDVMTANPVGIGPDASLHQALAVMEDRPSQISVLPVLGPEKELLGLLRLHDVYSR